MSDPPAVRRAEESIVEKPWGYEVRWAITDQYLGKILHVRKGEALSLQYQSARTVAPAGRASSTPSSAGRMASSGRCA
jgi:hypothetical protein